MERTNKKEKIALSSVLAAILLTSMKLIVGILTNSLGILSEALHSGIDLIAAGTTYFAVKKADKPPDQDHTYGHGKIENLSSLIETLLLFITCIWIVYEAVSRLFFKESHVDLGISALVVMVISMVIDYSRSRALMRTAKECKSQALEADAIHFSTDLLSSAVVIIGIIPTMLGFNMFDSIAALGVAAVTAFIAYRIGKKSVNALLDMAPTGTQKEVFEEASKVNGVRKVGQIRLRESGPSTFIDITVFIDKILSLEQAHRVTEELTLRLQSAIPGSDVVVHAEPYLLATATLVEKICSEATEFPEIKNIHNIRLSEFDKMLQVDFHLEFDPDLPLLKAHEVATALETRVKNLDPSIGAATSHFEPVDNGRKSGKDDREAERILAKSIEGLVRERPDIKHKSVDVMKVDGRYRVSLCCAFSNDSTVYEAHMDASKIESAIKLKHPEVESVTVHQEPSD